jgi:hypothetical protein
MKINTRPLAVTFVGAAAILLLMLYVYQAIGQIVFLLGGCLCYGMLGLIVGRGWPVNAWQISLIGSIPAWVFITWRMYSSRDPYNLHLDLSLFIWLPLIAILSLYVGTYTSRWLAIKRRMR